MTSEIRTNSLKSRAGLSTVTLTDSGPMFSGITTFVDNSGFTFGVGAGSSIFTPATNTLTFGTNSNERVRIDSVGRVIIANGGSGGTADVNADNFVVKNYTSSGSCGISILNADNLNSTLYFGNASDAKHAEVVWSDASNLFLIGTSNAGASIKFRTADQSDALTIDSSGDMGLGTGVNIDRHFHVEGTDNVQGKFQNNAAICLIEFEDSNTTAGNRPSYGAVGNNGVIYAGGGERVRITSAGLVGVGLTNPQTVLHINNNVPVIRLTDANSSGTPDCELGGSGGNIDISADINGEKSDSVIRFNVDGGEKASITSGGFLQFNNDSAKIQLGASQDLQIYHNGSSNRIIAANADLIVQSQNYAIRSENGSSTYLNIKSNGAIALPDGTQGLRFGSAASEDFAIFHSGSNSHIDHFGTGNLYHDFSNDFYMRFYQSAGVVRTALYISNGGSSNPEFQLRSNPTSAPTNSGTHSPAVRFRGAGWNTNSGSVEVGTILQSEHYYWQSSVSNVFGQTYPDFKIKMKNSDNGSYVSKFIFSGNGNAAFNGSLTQNSSDIRLKENIQPITNSLEKVKSLSGFTYNWNKTAQDLGFKGGGHDELQVGLSAQDVEKIQPEVVKPAPVDNSYKTIQYEKLVPLLVEAIKEQQKQIETLEQENIALRVETLEQENIALRARVTNLEGE